MRANNIYQVTTYTGNDEQTDHEPGFANLDEALDFVAGIECDRFEVVKFSTAGLAKLVWVG